MRRALAGLVAASLLTVIAGCSPSPSRPETTATASPTTRPRIAPDAETAPETEAPSASEGVTGTVVRFSTTDTAVDVIIGADSPATRDFLSMLPLTLSLEELSGREKIAYLPRQLEYAGTPGTDPENGDLIYFTPWGNLGFYYNAAGIEYSDQTLHIGSYDALREQLDLLESHDVTVEVVQ